VIPSGDSYTQAQVDEIVGNRLREQEANSWRDVVNRSMELLPALTTQLGQQGALLAEISAQLEHSRQLFHADEYTPEEAAAIKRQARLGARLHWMSGRLGKTLAALVVIAGVAQTIASLYTAFHGSAHPITAP
jgi:hypothetical protein